MAKIRTWLDRHKRIKAFLLWGKWPTVVLVLFVLQVIFGVTVYYTVWIIVIFAKAPAEVLNHYRLMLAELRQFIGLLTAPTCIAAVLSCAKFLYDPEHDGVPNIVQGEEVNKHD